MKNNTIKQNTPEKGIEKFGFKDFCTVVFPKINLGKVINGDLKDLLGELNESTKIPFFIDEEYCHKNDIDPSSFEAIGNSRPIHFKSSPKYLNRKHYDFIYLLLSGGRLRYSDNERLYMHINKEDTSTINDLAATFIKIKDSNENILTDFKLVSYLSIDKDLKNDEKLHVTVIFDVKFINMLSLAPHAFGLRLP